MLIAIVGGLVCTYFYDISPSNAIRMDEFRTELTQKEAEANKTTEDFKQIIIHSSVDSLIHYPIRGNDISYYVFNKNNLVFWTDNQLDITNISSSEFPVWQFEQLPNAYCLVRSNTFDDIKIISVIKIKNNYP